MVLYILTAGVGTWFYSSTAATVLLGTLFPALFTATTRYSRFIPRGWSVRNLVVARALWISCQGVKG